MDFYAIVHNDFDGTASAAVYSRAVNSLPKKVWFTEPTKLHNLLAKLELRGVSDVMIADLGINASTFPSIVESLKRLVGEGAKVQWFDHHVWKEEWKSKLKEIGVEVYHDTSTCGAGVVHKYMNPNDEFSAKLASADCSVDIWLHDDPMGEKLRRVVEGNRDFSWKEKLIQTFYNGVLWNDEFQKILEDKIDEELRGYQRLKKYFKVIEVDGKKVAVAIRWKGAPDISYAGQYIMTRTGAVVFASANGKAISFRSNHYEVRKFATRLGGGGHPLAAGAGLKLPLIYRVLRRLGWVTPALNWVSNVVSNVIKEEGFTEYK
ncbi:MAG: DHHA1 domain-containing protein [Candidatus Aramenus sulfurataquae]|jgi:oligoribonuclease NrnB/cAMP/cGMP phosphodiesterase (DHH superfamily)|uniref:DHHA1 domain-containing protein n=2 Tax=Candidatus Aramenus sulfurataquae TaxID=1326980 RepID=A0AAE3FKW7_9CREN|nr:DHHA1 domain-containing protein [Candidatus Aramenus sulfurataquae]